MRQIKFSHLYPKLHGQVRARLMEVIMVTRKDLDDEFIEYDTHYVEPNTMCRVTKGYYPLAEGTYVLLVFLGDKMIPFTTVRPWKTGKDDYYRANINYWFDIVMLEDLT